MSYAQTMRKTHRALRAAQKIECDGETNTATLKVAGLAVNAANAALADVTATAPELNEAANVMSSASTIALSVSAAVQTATVTVKDADGNTIAAVHQIRLYLATSNTGVTLAAAANGTVAPTTGTILKAHTAKLDWDLMTDTNGVAVLSIDNTGGSDHYAVYVCVRLPNNKLKISLVTDVRAA